MSSSRPTVTSSRPSLVYGRTVHRAELEETAAACARAAGIVGVANVQLRYSDAGEPALLEINPRRHRDRRGHGGG